MTTALILDLDNTIYPVSSIAEYLFARLFAMLDENAANINYNDILNAKDELTRRPFHLVADKYGFGEELTSKGISFLNELTYNMPMQPFKEYDDIKSIPAKKFLVTTGFSKLQWSKVKMLNIEADFEEIHIVDPEKSKQTKKDVFADIMYRHHYQPTDVLIIGDDPESEIKAATALGIPTFLFDPENKHQDALATYRANNLNDVLTIIS